MRIKQDEIQARIILIIGGIIFICVSVFGMMYNMKSVKSEAVVTEILEVYTVEVRKDKKDSNGRTRTVYETQYAEVVDVEIDCIDEVQTIDTMPRQYRKDLPKVNDIITVRKDKSGSWSEYSSKIEYPLFIGFGIFGIISIFLGLFGEIISVKRHY